jgi:hypothetical protein
MSVVLPLAYIGCLRLIVVSLRRAVSVRKKKERELTVQEKRAVAERVMEAATRRRDEILLQRAQCVESPSGRCVEHLAAEVADTVIEHALLDQRMLRASALQSRDDSPDVSHIRRDRAREMLVAQMGLATRRKAALASQQDRGTRALSPRPHSPRSLSTCLSLRRSTVVVHSCHEPRKDCEREG